MNFIPVYKDFKVQPKTYMAQEISKYAVTDKTLDWMNIYYPAGLQNKFGASSQKFISNEITVEQYAKELQDAFKGAKKIGAKFKSKI